MGAKKVGNKQEPEIIENEQESEITQTSKINARGKDKVITNKISNIISYEDFQDKLEKSNVVIDMKDN